MNLLVDVVNSQSISNTIGKQMQSNVHLVKILFKTVVVGLMAAFSSHVQADLIIDGFTAEKNDRFTNAPEFIGNSIDLNGTSVALNPNAFSGIGIAFQNQTANPDSAPFLRYGTLVSRNVILTSGHSTARRGEITFYPDNDPNSTPITRNIIDGSAIRLEGSDLIAAVLDRPVPDGFVHYTFADVMFEGDPPEEVPTPDPDDDPDNTTFQNQIETGSDVPFSGDTIVHVGGSEIERTGLEARRIDQAVGLNRVSGYIENTFSELTDEPDNNDTLILVQELRGDSDFLENESFVQGGDSGGPVFALNDDASLTLLGLNSIRGEVSFSNGDTRNFTGVGYVGNHEAQLSAFIEANAVPEPNSAMIVLGGLCGQILLRRRRISRTL